MKKYLIFTATGLSIFYLMAELGSDKSDLIFSHKLHIEDAGASCSDCHESALTSEKSEDNLFPAEKSCFQCHNESETGCNFCHTTEDSIKSAYRIQSSKYKFSHKLHLAHEQECLVCHESIKDKIKVEKKPVTEPVAICKKCHENVDYRENTAGCLLCHDKAMPFKPSDHNIHWEKEHGIAYENNREQCNHCHQKLFCLSCHEGDNLDHRAHPLNFRNNHGIFAKGNKDNCMTCHQDNRYCQDCHRIQLVKPKNHFLSGWIRLNNGGKHASSAMADFDKCLSCHDDMNSDIICVYCHQN
jgi:hypothetical protein